MAQQPRARRLIIIAVIFLVLMGLIFLTARERTRQSLPERFLHGVIAPFQKIVTGLADFFRGTVQTIAELGRLRRDNQQLRAEAADLRAEQEELEFYRRENIRLRAALGFKERRPLDMVASEVIGRNPSNWLSTLTIDKGSRDGLVQNMPVISRQGVVGRLGAVRLHNSDVLLVNDARAPIAGVVERTREQVRVLGRTDGLCIVTPYGRSADLRIGDRIVTWGGSAYFPPGLVIGRIISVEQDNFGVSNQGTLETAVDFHRLEDVFVIKSLDSLPVNTNSSAGGD